MKTIDTLIEDINGVLLDPTKGIFHGDEDNLSGKLSEIFSQRLSPQRDRDRGGERGTLRFSNLGTPCDRLLYYVVNNPQEGEPFLPNTLLKFLYGDILESLLLSLARRAGHVVTGEQDTLEIAGIKGHRDAIIDGVLVDCKSASSNSFKKFEAGLRPEDDSFGYLTQLKLYLSASKDDPLLKEKNKAGFFVVNKETGSIHLDMHTFSDKDLAEVAEFVEGKKAIVNGGVLPERGFEDEKMGESGNRKLGTNCSYCPRKFKCWPDLKTYLYSRKPVFLTKVVKEPNVNRF